MNKKHNASNQHNLNYRKDHQNELLQVKANIEFRKNIETRHIKARSVKTW